MQTWADRQQGHPDEHNVEEGMVRSDVTHGLHFTGCTSEPGAGGEQFRGCAAGNKNDQCHSSVTASSADLDYGNHFI